MKVKIPSWVHLLVEFAQVVILTVLVRNRRGTSRLKEVQTLRRARLISLPRERSEGLLYCFRGRRTLDGETVDARIIICGEILTICGSSTSLLRASIFSNKSFPAMYPIS